MIIVDVGAHDGSACALPSASDPDNLVFAIEPIPELAGAMSARGLDNLHVRSIALGARDEMREFFVNRDKATSSLLQESCEDSWAPYAERLETARRIEVQVVRLSTFMAQEGLAHIDFLKLNAQGADFDVLLGAGDRLKDIARIQLEVQLEPLYHGAATKEELVDFLSARGFRLSRATAQTEGLEENLEFIQVDRFNPTPPGERGHWVDVPGVGPIAMPADDLVAMRLEEGAFEPAEQAFFWMFLRSGDTFLDCGAHAGLFSAIAARRVKRTGHVVAFEPHPEVFELLESNLERDGPTLSLNQAALSDRAGELRLKLGRKGHAAFSSLASGSVEHDEIGEEELEVSTTSIDRTARELGLERIDLVKIDVEGWEERVLVGATETILAGKMPLCMVELTERNAQAVGSSTQALRKLLADFGFQLFRFDPRRLQLIPEPGRLHYRYTNLFAAKDVDEVNKRLSAAKPRFRERAQALIRRGDQVERSERRFRDMRVLLEGRVERNEHASQQRADRLREERDRHRAAREKLVAEQAALRQTLRLLESENRELVRKTEELDRSRKKVDELRAKLEQTEGALKDLEQSVSWRLTEPLRLAKRRWRKG